MRRTELANWVGLIATIILILTFFGLPLVSLPLEQSDSSGGETTIVHEGITAANILANQIPEIDYQLPDLSLLQLGVILGLITAAVSLYPPIKRSARYAVLVAGMIGMIAYIQIPLFNTGADFAIAQQLHLGFWVGILACIAMILQIFIPSKSDKIADTAIQFLSNIDINRTQLFGAVLFILGALLLISAIGMSSDISTVLVFTGGKFGAGNTNTAPILLSVPTLAYTLIVGVYYLIAGGVGLTNSRKHRGKTFGTMLFAGVLVFPTILILAAAGDQTNATTMLTESFRTATPIAIGAMAGIWCERSGVINIAIEGMMLFGAAVGFTTLFLLRGAYPEQAVEFHMFLGVTSAIITGGLVAMLHAWLSITFATDQIVSGTVINILALGSTNYIRRAVLLSNEGGFDKLRVIEIPFLSKLPAIGPIFSGQPIFYLMFVVIILTHIVLFQTRWGLRTRAVGENPEAADTLGIKVNRIRWTNVIIGGMIAGLAGAWFSLESSGRFTNGMTDGKGFISLAAMIFGKWTPAGSFGGALLFGFSEALGFRLQIENIGVHIQFLQMVPYVVTLVVLAGFVGRAIPPKAIGKPYKKE
jgi:simple sugar transport system permease protein